MWRIAAVLALCGAVSQAEEVKMTRFVLNDGTTVIASSYFAFEQDGKKSYQIKRNDGVKVTLREDQVKEMSDEVLKLANRTDHEEAVAAVPVIPTKPADPLQFIDKERQAKAEDDVYLKRVLSANAAAVRARTEYNTKNAVL